MDNDKEPYTTTASYMHYSSNSNIPSSPEKFDDDSLLELNILQYNQLNAKLVINGMFLNQDNSLFSIATNFGYKIFESYNLVQVSENNEIHEMIGALKICIPMFQSHVVIFVGKDALSTFPDSQLVLWNDARKQKIGVIIMKEKIWDAKVSKDALFVKISSKILVYDIKNLNCVCSVLDVQCSPKLVINYITNPICLLNVSQIRANQIKLTKCKYLIILVYLNDSIRSFMGKSQLIISTPFTNISIYTISKKGDLACIIGSQNNTIHIYSLIDFQVKYCFVPESGTSNTLKITNINFSKKSKFISLFYENSNLEIYNLLIEQTLKNNCDCHLENLNENDNTQYINSSNGIGERAKIFFSKTYGKIKNLLSKNKNKSFCKYNLRQNELKEIDTLSELIKSNNFTLNEHKILNLIQFEKSNELELLKKLNLIQKKEDTAGVIKR